MFDAGPRNQLVHALALLLVTGGALLAATLLHGGESSSSTTRTELDPNPLEVAETSLELLPRVARRVEAMRGLSFDRVPLPRVVTTDFIGERIASDFRSREGDPEDALAADEATARITGLLEADEDLLGMVEGAGDLAAAAWDTERKRLYIVAGTGAVSPQLIELSLAHELTHALEDQRFGLTDASAGGDRALAETALTEGTATALMLEYARRHLDVLALGAAALAIDPGTEGIPDFVVEQLEWAYLEGARFVERLYELGDGWTLIDRALERRPPASTSQVLHPRKYLRDERPLAVEIDGDRLREAGWRIEDGGTLGELATRQIVAVGVREAVARKASAGWAGDRYELWRLETPARECTHPCREELALVIRWRWESASNQTAFARAARRYVEHGLDGRAAGDRTWALEGGWAAMSAEGRTTILAFAPSASLARRAARP